MLSIVVLIALAWSSRVVSSQQWTSVGYRYNLSYYINELQRTPIYVDTSGACAKLFFGAYRVAKNCSSLNVAANFSVLTVDTYYVTELIVSNNNFGARLPYYEINMYDSLDYLDLSFNMINEFTTDLQLIDCSVNYLKEINLNYNMFSRFPVFNRTCGCLRALRLNNNKNLVVLDNPLVYMNNVTRAHPSLIYLDLANCSIQYINMNNYTLFYHFPSLAYLNLYGNQILMIYWNPFLWAPPLNYLTFEGNQIQCTVDILWVKYYLLYKPAPKILTIQPNGSVTNILYSPTCFSILTNITIWILNATNSSFYTNIYLTSSRGNNTVINANCGDTVDLDCSAYSVPTPDLWWTFDDRVLSRIVTTERPYQFIENFNAINNPYNKTSILRIKNVYDKLSGIYSCKTTYLNLSQSSIYNNIPSIFFTLNVNGCAKPLPTWAIALIVVGALIAFLIACCLIALCVWCCCFQLGWCLWCCFCCPCCARLCPCCPGAAGAGAAGASRRSKAETSSKSRLYSSSRYDSTTAGRRFNVVSDLEEKCAGFDDISTGNARPNYVINSITKSNSSICDQIDANKSSYQLSSNEFYQIIPPTTGCVDTSTSSWRVCNNKPSAHQQSSSSYQDVLTHIDQDTMVYNVSSRKQQPPPSYVVSSNEAFVSDTVTTTTAGGGGGGSGVCVAHHSPTCSPKFGRRVLAEEFATTTTTTTTQPNRYVPSPLQQQQQLQTAQLDEMFNDNYFSQVMVDDDCNYTKQYRNIPIAVTTASSMPANTFVTTSYPKYDSDV